MVRIAVIQKEKCNTFFKIIKCEECKKIQGYQPYPVPTFKGEEYEEKRILIIGQNPNLGKDDANKKTLEDIKKIENEKKFQKFFLSILKKGGWRILNNYNWVKEGLGLDFKNIAFTNLFKCPCPNKKSQERMEKNCTKKFLKNEIPKLKPKVIISIGVPAREFIEKIKEGDSVFHLIKQIKRDGHLFHLMHTSRNNARVERTLKWDCTKDIKNALNKLMKQTN